MDSNRQHASFPLGRLDFARKILRAEADALINVANRLDAGFEHAVDLLAACRGRVCVTGVGKPAEIGRKIAATLNSTGTRAYPLDATAALHGDLGMVADDDVVLILSHSGESDEILRLLPWLKVQASALVALTSNASSSLARRCDAIVCYGTITESCPLSLAPSTSTTVMLALGDALAFTLSEMKAFTREQFAGFHPAGSLGRKLARVEACMRRDEELRVASASATVREVFVMASSQPRRTGAIILIDDEGRLCGLFTDSDLARLFEQRRDAALDRPIAEVMTTRPLTIQPGLRLLEAIEIFREYKISELPVVDEERRPVGLLDITDLLGQVPAEAPPVVPYPRVSA